MPTTLTVVTYFILLVVAALSLVGSIYEIKATQRSINSLKKWQKTTCHTTNLTCGIDKDNYVDHCELEGYYYYGGDSSVNVSFRFRDFGESVTIAEVEDRYLVNGTFSCYYIISDDTEGSEIFIKAPTIDYNYLIYEYLFSVFIAVLIGVGLKIHLYNKFESRFIPHMGWHESVESIWDKKNKNSMEYPFDQLILIDMIFFVIVFLGLAFANISSLNHIYGFIPILILGILGSFEKYANAHTLNKPSSKIHFVLANYSFTFAWCLTSVFSKIVLCARDPFRDLRTYIVSMFMFLLYLTIKGYYFKMATHLWRKYFSNDMIEENAKAND